MVRRDNFIIICAAALSTQLLFDFFWCLCAVLLADWYLTLIEYVFGSHFKIYRIIDVGSENKEMTEERKRSEERKESICRASLVPSKNLMLTHRLNAVLPYSHLKLHISHLCVFCFLSSNL